MFNPLDTLRIRWQVSTTAQAEGNIVNFARTVVRTEGLLRGLWIPGVVANSTSIAMSSGLRMGFYPLLRDWLDMTLAEGGEDGEKGKSAVSMMVASFCAGGIGYWISTPTYQVKVRLQSQTEFVRNGGRAKYKGLVHALSTIVREEGVGALYRGSGALLVRGALITLGQLTAYDLTKTRAKNAGLLHDGPVLHLVASVVSAFFMATLSAPADILMTRYQTAPQSGITYRGLFHCATSMVKAEGPMVFYRGWSAFFIRLAPLNLVLFPLYEQLRRLFGLGYLD